MTSFEPRVRADSWSATNPNCSARFQMEADAVPDVLSRILNFLAMQYLVPDHLAVIRRGDLLCIELQVGELSWHRAEVICNKMRNLVDVAWVQLSDARQPAEMVQAS